MQLDSTDEEAAALLALRNRTIENDRYPAVAAHGLDGAGVLELIEDHRGGTYRAVYTVRFATRIHGLRAFQKKAKRALRRRNESSISSASA
jgi:phage-related protein